MRGQTISFSRFHFITRFPQRLFLFFFGPPPNDVLPGTAATPDVRPLPPACCLFVFMILIAAYDTALYALLRNTSSCVCVCGWCLTPLAGACASRTAVTSRYTRECILCLHLLYHTRTFHMTWYTSTYEYVYTSTPGFILKITFAVISSRGVYVYTTYHTYSYHTVRNSYIDHEEG